MKPWTQNRRYTIGLVFMGMVMVMIVAIGISMAGFTQLVFSYTSSKTIKPAVSWNEQLSTAMQAAQKINPDVLLWDISAHVKGRDRDYNWSPDHTLYVRFYFVTPQKQEIEVTIEDSDPLTTLKTEVRYRGSVNLFLDRRGEISQSLGSVMVSPREASRITWADASMQEKLLGTELYPIIGLNRDTIPAVWQIGYADANSQRITRKIKYDVDAKTGAIKSIEEVNR